jgi:hypothetical protein
VTMIAPALFANAPRRPNRRSAPPAHVWHRTPKVWAPSPVRTRRSVRMLVESRPVGLGQLGYDPPSYFDFGWSSVFVAGCEAIGANPYDVAGLLMSESGFNPSATNSIGCVGLNQMCPGSQNFTSDYSSDAYAQLTVSEQLPYVFAFWENQMSQYGLITISARDLYWLNFLPATYVPNSSDSYVISQQGDAYYSSNSSLDTDGSGTITAGDLMNAISAAESNNSSLYFYLAEMITLSGGPVAYFPWPWLAAGSLLAGVALFYGWQKYHWRLPIVGG